MIDSVFLILIQFEEDTRNFILSQKDDMINKLRYVNPLHLHL